MGAVRAEIVRRSRKHDLRAQIDELVRKRVDEILAQRDAELFEPDLALGQFHNEALRRMALFDRNKWALYFEKWGCRCCKKKKLAHDGRGYCHHCYHREAGRLRQLKKEWDIEHPPHPPELDAIDEKIRQAKQVFAAGSGPESGE